MVSVWGQKALRAESKFEVTHQEVFPTARGLSTLNLGMEWKNGDVGNGLPKATVLKLEGRMKRGQRVLEDGTGNAHPSVVQDRSGGQLVPPVEGTNRWGNQDEKAPCTSSSMPSEQPW